MPLLTLSALAAYVDESKRHSVNLDLDLGDERRCSTTPNDVRVVGHVIL